MALSNMHIALIISIMGLIVLTYAGDYVEPPCSRVSQVSAGGIGKNVRLCGNVSEFHIFNGGSAVITLQDDSGSIPVYLPYGVASSLEDLADMGSLEVIGSVKLYSGRIEVFVESRDFLKINDVDCACF